MRDFGSRVWRLGSGWGKKSSKRPSSNIQRNFKLQAPNRANFRLVASRVDLGKFTSMGQAHHQINSNEFKPFQMISNEFKSLFKKIINHEPHEKLRPEI
jgi:hypothetical protein